MNERFKGKSVAVTGGASGIGEATARRLAAEGALLVILDANAPDGARVASEIGGRSIQVDVSDERSVEAAFASIDRLDALVNSAGVAHVGDLLSTKVEDLDRLYNVNVKGTFLAMRAALSRMIAQGSGAIVNLASVASKIGLADRFAYQMSKGAVLSMTLSAARDYVGRGVRINCVCPARIYTPFVEGYLAKNYPDRRDEEFAALSSYQPIGRMGRPDEVAGLIAYLCSDEAAFVTGSAYDIDGGVTLLR